MLAQLKNQDPTSPVDSNTFLTQLAELSEVQGITSLNTSFSALSGSLTSNQALQASSLLGHQALVSSSTASIAANGAITGAINVPQTTSQVVLNISDSSGALVGQINLGAQSAGLASFSWNGKEGDGSQAPAGTYTLSALYAGATSGGTAATTLVNGTIESVSMVDNLAAIWGDDACVETPTAGGPSHSWQGRWLTVYQLQPDGSWLIVRDSGEEAK